MEISALQKGQSGYESLVSIHFITQWSWKICLHGVSLIIVEGANSSTQMAQLSWFSLKAVCEYFFRGNCLPIRVSFYLFCYSKMRWAATGSWILSASKFSSSIEFWILGRYLQKMPKLVQQHKSPTPRQQSTIMVKVSIGESSLDVQRKSSLVW